MGSRVLLYGYGYGLLLLHTLRYTFRIISKFAPLACGFRVDPNRLLPNGSWTCRQRDKISNLPSRFPRYATKPHSERYLYLTRPVLILVNQSTSS